VVELEGGVDGAAFSPDETNLLRQAITQEFNDAKLGAAPLPEDAISVTTPLALEMAVDTRMLDVDAAVGVTRQVAFKVKMNVPRFETAALKKYLDMSMSSGLFVTRIRSLCRSVEVVNLKSVTRASLLDLRVIHETMENKEFSLMATMVVCVWGLVGLIFGVLLIASYMRSTSPKYTLVNSADLEVNEMRNTRSVTTNQFLSNNDNENVY